MYVCQATTELFITPSYDDLDADGRFTFERLDGCDVRDEA